MFWKPKQQKDTIHKPKITKSKTKMQLIKKEDNNIDFTAKDDANSNKQFNEKKIHRNADILLTIHFD